MVRQLGLRQVAAAWIAHLSDEMSYSSRTSSGDVTKTFAPQSLTM